MIRQVTAALKQHYQDHKYSGGKMSRVSDSPKSHHYDSQVVQQKLQSPSSSTTSHATIHRHYRSKIPILKPANWRIFHELLDVHQLMQDIKQQQLYLQTIHTLLNTITGNLRNHAQTPDLVLSYFDKPSAIKAIHRTPPLPAHPRSEYFNPTQIVVGNLVARKFILPESNEYYQPDIQRARLIPNALCDDTLNTYGASHLTISRKDIRKEEYKRHYKLDPEHWYTYWPKNRHTKNSKQNAVQRFIYTISENDHWCLPTKYYQKQGPTTWTLAPPPSPNILVDHELRERECLAKSIYKQLYQLTN